MSGGGREEAERGEMKRESFLRKMRKSGVYVLVCVRERGGGGIVREGCIYSLPFLQVYL